MYLCLSCGQLFKSSKRYYGETLAYQEGYCREEYEGCPYCSDGKFTEAKYCDNCSEAIATDSYYAIGNENYCCDCVKEKYLEET